MRELTYTAAAREGLDEEMARDSTVFVVGEGIGERGGNFKRRLGSTKSMVLSDCAIRRSSSAVSSVCAPARP